MATEDSRVREAIAGRKAAEVKEPPARPAMTARPGRLVRARPKRGTTLRRPEEEGAGETRPRARPPADLLLPLERVRPPWLAIR